MSRRSSQFSSVRTEGGLLPQDVLSRIQSGDKTLPGLTPESYHLGPHERIGEAVNRAWSRLTAAWHGFEEALAKEPDAALATGLTRDRWLLPLFQELGYGRLPKGQAIDVEGKTFAVSHTWHLSPIHLLGSGVDLDRRQAGVAGAAKASPHGLVQEFLNRSDDHLWGFVSNGLQLRVLRDHHSLTRQAYIEFDLQSIMQGEQYSEFLLLWMVCHQSRVEAEKPDDCWLERWFKTSRDEGVRALDKLRGGVEKAIEAFGTGFLAHKANTKLRDALESGELDKQEYYRQVLRLVYRLIFLFVAEEREALLDPDADEAAKNRYLKFYATRRLRALADKRRGSPHGDAWQGLRLVISKLDDGCPELALPAFGSRLWGPTACPWLMDADCGNEPVLGAIRHLSNIQEGRTRYPVNWRNVGADELGSIYEGLLELHPRINKEASTFKLDTAAGHERKTTGSYYTPTGLVDCLLDSALDPVIDGASNEPDPEQAILDLKVCDPACGSGHFLVAATRRIAKRLAAVRAGEDEPSPKDVQRALRDVVGRCIYGVDVNPMAVELCKVSLWMEAIEPGRPLSFLDSHIQCGNALLGATPALMARGVPDDAFKPIEGDDTGVAKRLKKRNADERKGQTTIFTLLADDPSATGKSVAAQAAGVENVADSDIESIREKEKRWDRMSRSAEFRDAWFKADTWCSAFLWPKEEGELENTAVTHELWRRINSDVTAAPQAARQTIRQVARRYRFFHWHLAFPHIFRGLKPEITEADVTGWTGGFDAVVGNPPWEAADLMKVEFFSVRVPEVVTATTTADREGIIHDAVRSNPDLGTAWVDAQRVSQGERHLVTKSGRFPATSGGKYNTYRTFAELGTMLIGGRGRSGLILKSGIINAQANQAFFAGLLLTGRVVGANDFINTAQLFPSVVGNERFCTLTVCGSDATVDQAVFRFGLTDPAQLREEERVLRLGAREVRAVNPNDNSVPPVTSPRDLRLLLGIHERLGILSNVAKKENPHGARYKRGHLNSSTDSGLFKEHTFEKLNGEIALSGNGWISTFVPLAEGKLIATFNHRFGCFRGVPPKQRFGKKAQPARSRVEDLVDPDYRPFPRFWVEADAHDELARKAKTTRGWVLAFRHVCRAIVDARTAQFCIAPCETFSDSCAFVLFKAGKLEAAQSAAIVCASMTSFVGDYVLRQKIYGPALTKAILLQLPTPSRAAVAKWPGLGDGLAFVTSRVLELTYTSWSLADYAADLGHPGPPFRWDDDRRFLLRCELDAAFFHLYGVSRDDAEYIMETFPIVKRKEVDEYGEFRSKARILDIYSRMQQAIDGARPYETEIDPPPADQLVAHPPREDRP